jgi:hypothetical protein
MEIEPKLPTAKGAAETFTGDVYVDPIATRKPEPSRMIVSRVRSPPAPGPLDTAMPSGRPCTSPKASR